MNPAIDTKELRAIANSVGLAFKARIEAAADHIDRLAADLAKAKAGLRSIERYDAETPVDEQHKHASALADIAIDTLAEIDR